MKGDRDMLRTIKFGFNEPITGFWVEGKNELFFKNERDMMEILREWEHYLSRLYGADIKLVIVE